jgi:putative ABC transport system permease protein
MLHVDPGPLHALAAAALLAAGTLLVAALLGLERPWLQPWAVLRAAVQLGVLSLVLRGVISSLPLTLALLAVMVIVAAATSRQRLGLSWRMLPAVALIVAISAALPAAVALGTGAVAFEPRYLLAVAGILVGNAMTAVSLMGRSLRTALQREREVVEGWLALGATPRRAALPVVRAAGSTAVLPATDQTRTTGVVTLPGAFVGAVFGGASPIAAAEFQLVVLAGILLTGVLAVAGVGLLLGAPETLPTEPPRLG